MLPNPRQTIERYLADCGVRIGTGRPTDLRVHDERLYARLMAQGSLGLGEAYMDGWWDAADLEGLLTKVLSADVDQRVRSWRDVAAGAIARLWNLQSRARAFQVGQRHYDLGNALFERMLDRRMIYSCAYWSNADSLDGAQEAKLDLVFGKLGLKHGDQVLDVGCGWGGALRYAVERHDVAGTGVTISREQADYARRVCAGLPVAVHLQDYRALRGRCDHAYSIGMFEHVGPRNYRTYFQTVGRCLVPGGRFLLHTIGTLRESRNAIDPWMAHYIFPNAAIPRQKQITDAIDGLFRIEGWQRIGTHYVRTLLAWLANFEHAWPDLAARYDERFMRMWRYYLSASAAAFRAGVTDVWQVLLTRG